jgi:hypothetical protein
MISVNVALAFIISLCGVSVAAFKALEDFYSKKQEDAYLQRTSSLLGRVSIERKKSRIVMSAYGTLPQDESAITDIRALFGEERLDIRPIEDHVLKIKLCWAQVFALFLLSLVLFGFAFTMNLLAMAQPQGCLPLQDWLATMATAAAFFAFAHTIVFTFSLKSSDAFSEFTMIKSWRRLNKEDK